MRKLYRYGSFSLNIKIEIILIYVDITHVLTYLKNANHKYETQQIQIRNTPFLPKSRS